MARVAERRGKKGISEALASVIKARLGDRKPAWLARSIHERFGIWHDASYYSHVLNRDYRPGPEELQAICELLDVDPEWAFEEAGYPRPQPREQQDRIPPYLRAMIEQMSDDQISVLVDLWPVVEQLVDKVLARQYQKPVGDDAGAELDKKQNVSSIGGGRVRHRVPRAGERPEEGEAP